MCAPGLCRRLLHSIPPGIKKGPIAESLPEGGDYLLFRFRPKYQTDIGVIRLTSLNIQKRPYLSTRPSGLKVAITYSSAFAVPSA